MPQAIRAFAAFGKQSITLIVAGHWNTVAHPLVDTGNVESQ